MVCLSIVAFWLCFSGSARNVQAEAGPNTGATAIESEISYIFLPYVAKPSSLLYGTVTENGQPAADVEVYLFSVDAHNSLIYSDWALTNADGVYEFRDAPALTNGQYYYAGYYNFEENADRLASWETGRLTSFGAGSVTHLNDFDIATVSLISPSAGLAISFPYTFRWQMRSASPTDTYDIVFYYQDTNCGFRTLDIGRVDSLRVNELRDDFKSGVTHHWNILIHGPDGSEGLAYARNSFSFSE